MSLHGRHALVCGASQGIGRQTAMALAAKGAAVTLLARNKDALAEAAEACKAAGAPEAHTLAVDLDQREGLATTVSAHIEAVGPVHILINNAGGPPGGPLLNVTDEEAFTVPFGRHVLASHALLRTVLPGMQEAGWGRIVNIISTSVREPIPGLGVSNTIRGAMASWAKTISKELPPGITINSVLPGFTDTGRLGSLAENKAKAAGQSTDEIYDAWAKAAPEGRIGKPEEVAAAVAWFASPEASFVRGTVLAVDGGRLNGI